MIRKVLRFRVLPGGRRVAQLDKFVVRIDACLGPPDVPVDERDDGYRIQGIVSAQLETVLWEDWRPTLEDAKFAAAEWLADRLGASRWGVA